MERHYVVGLIIPGVLISIVGMLALSAGLSSSASADADERNAKDHGGDALEIAAAAHQYDSVVTEIGVVHLAIGVPLLASGLLFPRHVYVPNQASFGFVPMISKDLAGATLVMSF